MRLASSRWWSALSATIELRRRRTSLSTRFCGASVLFLELKKPAPWTTCHCKAVRLNPTGSNSLLADVADILARALWSVPGLSLHVGCAYGEKSGERCRRYPRGDPSGLAQCACGSRPDDGTTRIGLDCPAAFQHAA